MIKLYSYWRSSAAYRVRIALHLKGLDYEIVPVNMLQDGGEQHSAAYRALNPQGLVPLLVDGELGLTQSLAILDYLEERYPQPALLPASAPEKAKARQIAQAIACDIHPLNNLRVLKYLSATLAIDDAEKDAWYQHWIDQGFAALETWLRPQAGPYCLGAAVTIADVCLIPQLYNAHRFKLPLARYPRLLAIEKACLTLSAFAQALPENQTDAI